MDQEQINISARSSDLLNALQQLGIGRLDRAGGAENLRRNKDLIAGHTTGAQGLTNLALITVELRGVDVSVSHVQSFEARLDALSGGGTVDAKTQARNALAAIGKREGIGDFNRHGDYGGYRGNQEVAKVKELNKIGK